MALIIDKYAEGNAKLKEPAEEIVRGTIIGSQTFEFNYVVGFLLGKDSYVNQRQAASHKQVAARLNLFDDVLGQMDSRQGEGKKAFPQRKFCEYIVSNLSNGN